MVVLERYCEQRLLASNLNPAASPLDKTFRRFVVKAYTHVLGGLCAAGIAIILHAPHPATVMAASAAGSLVPDWDHPKSLVGRLLPWPPVAASRGPRVAAAGGVSSAPVPMKIGFEVFSVG
jgi:hypothetical protein